MASLIASDVPSDDEIVSRLIAADVPSDDEIVSRLIASDVPSDDEIVSRLIASLLWSLASSPSYTTYRAMPPSRW